MTMTETLPSAREPESAPFSSSTRQWGAALKALRRLLSDKDDTGQVFEIMRALNGNANAKNYRRLLETQGGGRIAYEHIELAPKLMDSAWLDSFAAGTVGAAYRDFVRRENLSAEGLAEISRHCQARVEESHPYAWFGRRMRDSHDLWHILSGYHRDGLGEACLVAFSYAQTRGLGWALIALGATWRALAGGHVTQARAIWQGYRRGLAAKWLPGEDYVQLMGEPLDAARRRLNITPATIYDCLPLDARDPSAGNDANSAPAPTAAK
ncbi:MAG: Coq4 family protein [Rhizomicrobium sp.]|jgi:ubiquinone biosynthesis protein COQ4